MIKIKTISLLTLAVLAIENPSQADPNYSDCDSTCGELMNSQGQILGISGSVGWGPNDDAWCAANSSYVTDATMPVPSGGYTMENPAPEPSTSPIPSSNPYVAVTPTATLIARCQFHNNNQLIDQCTAYEAAHAVGPFEDVIMAMDVATTLVCANACFTTHTEMLCSKAAEVTGIADLADSLFMNDSGTGKLVNALMGSAGVAGGFITGTGIAPAASAANDIAADKIANSSVDPADKSALSKEKIESCATMALFAVMSGIRYNSMQQAQQARANSCSSINSLDSNATTLSGTASSTTGGAVTGGSTSGTVSGSGSTSGINPTTGQLISCATTTSINACGNSQAATAAPDTNLLATSGLGSQVAPLAGNLLGSGLASSGGAGSAMQGAANGGGLPTGVADQLAGIAQSAQDYAASPTGLGAMKGGGGVLPTGGSSDSAIPSLASLFGKSDKGATALTGNEFNFGTKESSDIFHTGSKLNLFEIVSGRVTKVQDRVDQLQWARPLNRAIAGQSTTSH